MSNDREDDDSPGSTEEGGSSGGGEEGAGNSGIMMIDASVAPADIAYPTDLNLLNESREKLEEIIDVLYEPVKGAIDKPRTYRQKARKSYFVASKRRKIRQKALRKALKQQLQYIHRDLKHVESLKDYSSLENLTARQYRNLLVIRELYHQQREMFEERKHSVSDESYYPFGRREKAADVNE